MTRERSRQPAERCPLCRDLLTRGTPRTCEDCGTVLHGECSSELGIECATLGCPRANLYAVTPGDRRERPMETAAGHWRTEIHLSTGGTSGAPFALVGVVALLFLLPLALVPAGLGAHLISLANLCSVLSGAALLLVSVQLVLVLLRSFVGPSFPLGRVTLGEDGVGRLSTSAWSYPLTPDMAQGVRGKLQSRWGMARSQTSPVYFVTLGGRTFQLDAPAEAPELERDLRAWGEHHARERKD